jgi:hypothetical protein
VSSLYSFVEKIRQSEGEDGCWIWQGAVGSDGYGRVRRRGTTYSGVSARGVTAG